MNQAYHILLMNIINDEILMSSDYEDYDSINSYVLTLKEMSIADKYLMTVAEEFVEMGLLTPKITTKLSTRFYRLTDYFKDNFKAIIGLYKDL
jgi:hypothetical protein